jgi:hypothetical protein
MKRFAFVLLLVIGYSGTAMSQEWLRGCWHVYVRIGNQNYMVPVTESKYHQINEIPGTRCVLTNTTRTDDLYLYCGTDNPLKAIRPDSVCRCICESPRAVRWEGMNDSDYQKLVDFMNEHEEVLEREKLGVKISDDALDVIHKTNIKLTGNFIEFRGHGGFPIQIHFDQRTDISGVNIQKTGEATVTMTIIYTDGHTAPWIIRNGVFVDLPKITISDDAKQILKDYNIKATATSLEWDYNGVHQSTNFYLPVKTTVNIVKSGPGKITVTRRSEDGETWTFDIDRGLLVNEHTEKKGE